MNIRVTVHCMITDFIAFGYIIDHLDVRLVAMMGLEAAMADIRYVLGGIVLLQQSSSMVQFRHQNLLRLSGKVRPRIKREMYASSLFNNLQ